MNQQTKDAITMAIDFLEGSYEAHKVRKALQEALAQQAQDDTEFWEKLQSEVDENGY